MGEKFDQIFEEQIQKVVDEKKEKIIENMLKDNMNAELIIKWTGATLEKIVAVAKRMGMDTLRL